MTKAQFIKEAKKRGFSNWKDALVYMGKSQRYIDRFKMREEITGQTAEVIEKWINSPQKQAAQPKPPKKEKKTKKQPKRNDTVGLIIPNKEYHANERLGASKIKLLLEDAREYYLRYVTKEVEHRYTDALAIGNLHHTLVLEHEMMDKEYIVLDMPARPLKTDYIKAVEELGGELETKQNTKGETVVSDTIDKLKEKLEKLKESDSRLVVTKAQLEKATETSKKALDSRFVIETNGKQLMNVKIKDLLSHDECYVERTFYGEIDGVKMQVRPDLLINLSKEGDFWFVIDLKTAENAKMSMFARQSSVFYYDIQEYIYREILKQNGINVREFRFNVAGKSETSKSAFYTLHKEDIEDAEKIVSKILTKYKWCKENDTWEEGFFDFQEMRFSPTKTVKLPAWRKFQLIDMGVL